MLKTYLLHLEHLNYSANSIRLIQDILQKFALYLMKTSHKDIKDATSHEVEQYILILKGRYSPCSVVRELSGLRCFFNYLKKEGVIFFNPLDLIEARVKIDKIPKHIPSQEAMIAFLNHPNPKFPEGNRDRAILELLYSSGLRSSEVINIRIPDMDFKKGIVFVRKAKFNKQRLVPVTQRALEAVSDYLENTRPKHLKDLREDRLFLNIKGPPLHRNNVREVVLRHRVAHPETMKMSPHGIRHAFASHMLKNGCDLVSLKDMLGHSRLDATQIYTHLDTRDLERVQAKHHPFIAQ